MADMPGFGRMNIADRGGAHEFEYTDDRGVATTSGPTPSQTVGPFFAYGLTPKAYGYNFSELSGANLVTSAVAGTRIVIEGQVFDGNGTAVHDG